jgi:two-component system, chemotaxis family, chemotaxis protein CheY
MGARILLVDDDPDILSSTQFLIEAEGYEVATAHNGREALACISRTPPDVILLDLMMPVMDGWQFVEELRKGPHAGLPIIVLSASHGLASKARQLGARGHVSKPFDVDDILRKIGPLVGPAHSH